MKKKLSRQAGFTLAELVVAIAISAVFASSVYTTFSSQQKAYRVNEQMAGLQQNLRTSMYFIAREVRMAGCDPTGRSGAGIITAGPSLVRFTADIDGNGVIDPSEDIAYSLYDSRSDGYMDIGRSTGGGNRQPLALKIDALDFRYLDENGYVLDDDGKGNVTESLSGIRSVQITIVARSDRAAPRHTDRSAYYNLVDMDRPILPAQYDGFRRRKLASEIFCRNLGL